MCTNVKDMDSYFIQYLNTIQDQQHQKEEKGNNNKTKNLNLFL